MQDQAVVLNDPGLAGLLRFPTLVGCLAMLVAACGSGGHDTTEAALSSSAGQTALGGASGGPAGASGARTSGGDSSGGSSAAGSATAGAGAPATSGGTGGLSGAANGGTPSSGGAEPIVVGKCDKLGAVGVWENISPPEFRNPSNMETQTVVVSQQDQSVYASAGNKTNGGDGGTGVFRSTDCGATWKLWSTGTSSDKLKSGEQWAMVIDPDHPQNLYVANGYGNDPTIYKSTNGGVDFKPLIADSSAGLQSSVQAIGMEPGNPLHLAVTFHYDCTAPNSALCMSTTNDGGDTWHTFNGPSELHGWQEAATLSVLGPSTYLYAANGAWWTTDGGMSWTRLSTDTFGASYAGSTLLMPDGNMYISGGAKLYRAGKDPTKSWTPIDNSPRSSVLIDDGENLFITNTWDYGGQPFYTAKLSDPTVWTHMPSPQIGRGAYQFAYDKTHHIVYASCMGAGLWRMVSR